MVNLTALSKNVGWLNWVMNKIDMYFYSGMRQRSSGTITSVVFFCLMIGCAMTCYSQSSATIEQHNADQKIVASGKTAANEVPEEEYFKSIYRAFYESYRLGPGDEIAIRVLGQPDYSFPKVKISPVGRVYHPLVGNIEVVGLTVPQLEKKLVADFSEYVINPQVSVSLEEAQSAKIGILGEVRTPSIVVISRPMTILEAINTIGGFTEAADRRGVVLLRQDISGATATRKIDVKKIMDGKARPEENLLVKGGDTIIVNSNFKKKMDNAMNSLRFTSFLSFIAFGRY